MSKRKGYGRVSSRGQQRDGNSLEDQKKKLMEAGCAEEDIVLEAFTGATMERPMFMQLIESLEPGDTLVVTKLDRFARTAADGVKMIKDLMARGVNVHVLNMGLIEDTPTGRLILNIMLAFAEFEKDNIVERLADGKVEAKAKNPAYKEGRKELDVPKSFEEYMQKVVAGTMTAKAACVELGISRSTWYKWARKVGA